MSATGNREQAREKGKLLDSFMIIALLVGIYALLLSLFVYNVGHGGIDKIGVTIGQIMFISFLVITADALYMWIGTYIGGANEALEIGDTFLAAIGSYIATWLFFVVCSPIPVIGNLLGIYLGLAISFIVIKYALRTSFTKSVLPWVLHTVVQAIALVVLICSKSAIVNQIFS